MYGHRAIHILGGAVVGFLAGGVAGNHFDTARSSTGGPVPNGTGIPTLFGAIIGIFAGLTIGTVAYSYTK